MLLDAYARFERHQDDAEIGYFTSVLLFRPVR
jgi:hypothetical protein